jgi:2'-5' RNA ligase
MHLLAIDVALLLPPDARARVVEMNARLSADGEALRLDDRHHPHVTLTQAFVRADELDAVLGRVDEVLRDAAPVALHTTGVTHSGTTLALAVDRRPELVALHEQIMEAIRGYERPGGTPAAFVDGEGRVGDVLWVTSYRLKSAFHAYEPHITIGHVAEPSEVPPLTFTADAVAVCHLGRYCTCQQVLRSWRLGGADRAD